MFRLTHPKRSFATTIATTGLLAITAMLASPAQAGSPTSNADNTHEYNAYVYGYIGMVFTQSQADDIADNWQLPNANKWHMLFWADKAAVSAEDGFKKCFKSLTEDTDALWQAAANDYSDAIAACDNLIVLMSMNGASSSEIQSVYITQDYLETALDAANLAHATSLRGKKDPLPGWRK